MRSSMPRLRVMSTSAEDSLSTKGDPLCGCAVCRACACRVSGPDCGGVFAALVAASFAAAGSARSAWEAPELLQRPLLPRAASGRKTKLALQLEVGVAAWRATPL